MINKSKMSNSNKGFGGESFAINYIESLGYSIIKQNYKVPVGEIDIIAKDGEYIVFIEVKARRNNKIGNPLEAVNLAKQKRIRKTAMYFLMMLGKNDIPMRFDVIGIIGTEITHIKNAF